MKTEHSEQVAFFKWVNEVAYAGFELVLSNACKPYDKQLVTPEPTLHLMHAIPNGGARGGDSVTNKIRGAMLRAEGVKKGVSDIFLPVSRNGKHGLYIELKIADRRKAKPSPEQVSFLLDVAKEGYETAICYGADEAKKVVCEYYGWNYES